VSVTATGGFSHWHAGQTVLMWQPVGAFGFWHAGQPLVWPVAAKVALSRYWFADEGGPHAVGREFAVVSPAPVMGLMIEIDCPLEAF
jgi:hypothetical protein